MKLETKGLVLRNWSKGDVENLIEGRENLRCHFKNFDMIHHDELFEDLENQKNKYYEQIVPIS